MRQSRLGIKGNYGDDVTYLLEAELFRIRGPWHRTECGSFREANASEIPNPPADCDSVDSEAGDLFQAYNDLPDLSVRYRNNGDFGHYQVAGMLRKLGYEPRQTQRISPSQRQRRCHFWA